MSSVQRSARRYRHVTAAIVFAVAATYLLVVLISKEGIQGTALWVIAGHQLVAHTVLIGWLWYLAGDDQEMET